MFENCRSISPKAECQKISTNKTVFFTTYASRRCKDPMAEQFTTLSIVSVLEKDNHISEKNKDFHHLGFYCFGLSWRWSSFPIIVT